ncbi:hypothetical protein ABK040_007409 [Willaertia magna]
MPCNSTIHKELFEKSTLLRLERGIKIAKNYSFNKTLINCWCCNRKHLELEKYYSKTYIKTDSSINKQIPLKILIPKLNENHTVLLSIPDKNCYSQIKLQQKHDKNFTEQTKQRIINEKLIPFCSSLINTSHEEFIHLISRNKESQKYLMSSSFIEKIKETNFKKSAKNTSLEIQNRYQLLAPIVLFGTNTSKASITIINNIQTKQTNKEKKTNKIIRTSFSRIRKAMNVSIFIKEIVNRIESSEFINFSILAKSLLLEIREKTNNNLNKIDTISYNKLLSSIYNPNTNAFHYDVPLVLKFIYIREKIEKNLQLDLINKKVIEYGGIEKIIDNNKIWNEIAFKLNLICKFKDIIVKEGYFYFNKICPPLKIFQRRISNVFNNESQIKMPSVSFKEATNNIESLFIGQYDVNDENSSYCFTFDQWVESFENPLLIYIGTPCNVSIEIDGHEEIVNGRIRKLSILILQHIIACYKRNFIKKEIKIYNLELSDWIDGVVILNKGLIKINVHIVWNNELFIESDESYNFVTKRLALLYLWCGESKTNIGIVSSFLREEYYDIKQFLYQNINFNISPRWCIGDYSDLPKRMNHKVGGHYRCCECGLCFKDSDPSDYLKCTEAFKFKKTLSECLKMKEFIKGQEGLPHIINDNKLLSLKDRNLENYELGSEILHVVKGNLNGLFNLFQNEKGFDIKGCSQSFNKEIRLGALKNTMSNADWRLAFIKFEITLLPFIQQEKPNAKSILLLIRDIIRYLYTKKEHSKIETQEFCVKVFLYGLLTINRWIINVCNLHHHILWIHIVHKCWKINLYHLSAENDERIFSIEKDVAKNNSNHQQHCVLLEILKREHFKQLVDLNYGNGGTSFSKIEKALKEVSEVSAVISSTILEHKVYREWIEKFKKETLEFNYPEYLLNISIINNHEIHGSNENVIEFKLVTEPTKLRGKTKCLSCGKKQTNITKCLIRCCDSCCENLECEYHSNKKKASENLAKQNFNTKPTDDHQSTTLKRECLQCGSKKVSKHCSLVMCSACCRKGNECIFHQKAKEKKKRKNNNESEVHLEGTTLMNKKAKQ